MWCVVMEGEKRKKKEPTYVFDQGHVGAHFPPECQQQPAASKPADKTDKGGKQAAKRTTFSLAKNKRRIE